MLPSIQRTIGPGESFLGGSASKSYSVTRSAIPPLLARDRPSVALSRACRCGWRHPEPTGSPTVPPRKPPGSRPTLSGVVRKGRLQIVGFRARCPAGHLALRARPRTPRGGGEEGRRPPRARSATPRSRPAIPAARPPRRPEWAPSRGDRPAGRATDQRLEARGCNATRAVCNGRASAL